MFRYRELGTASHPEVKIYASVAADIKGAWLQWRGRDASEKKIKFASSELSNQVAIKQEKNQQEHFKQEEVEVKVLKHEDSDFKQVSSDKPTRETSNQRFKRLLRQQRDVAMQPLGSVALSGSMGLVNAALDGRTAGESDPAEQEISTVSSCLSMYHDETTMSSRLMQWMCSVGSGLTGIPLVWSLSAWKD